MAYLLSVVLQTPVHSGIGGPLSYASASALPPGTLVRVPLGQREMLGIVWATQPMPAPAQCPPGLRPVGAALDALPPLNEHWRQLVQFSASYYQRSIGEVALAALPPSLRELDTTQLARRLRRAAPAPAAPDPGPAPAWPDLSEEQSAALQALRTQAGPFLLFGATGSGKTEVYLRCALELLTSDPQSQALVMVPEINLTPQLESRFRARFAPLYGEHAVVAMHSGMTPAQRLRSWLAAHSGQARIVLGTRMAVFASMPGLRLIVVDEEHDPSYKQQDGARYSARDLAVLRSQLESRQRDASDALAGCRVILGSATPALESWHHSRPDEEGGRYLRLAMPSRVGAGALPRVRLVDMRLQPAKTVFCPALLEAIRERVARGEQSLVLLNRRGWAPVLHCADCGWKSECPNCSAYRVFHKADRTLRCHHCSDTQRVPRACPTCGNGDIGAIGRGTEQIEEQLDTLLQDLRRPDGSPVRVARIDADSTRAKGALEHSLAQVHSGAVDVLVGTQMIAKGHDFRSVTLVAAVQPDSALFSSDFRAPERLFALLMQAGGRAGRDASQSARSELWVQTHHPQHPLYAALSRHDYPAFARQQLEEREQAGMPPFSFQALVRAEARTQALAQGFLQAASAAAGPVPTDPASGAADTPSEWATALMRYPAVPMAIARVANVERAQMLVESPSRAMLLRFLAQWQETLHQTRARPEWRGVTRWAIDVDPQSI